MGSLVLPVRELLSEPQLVLDQWMPLDGALPESEILLRAELKVREYTLRFMLLLRFMNSPNNPVKMCELSDPELKDDWSSTALCDWFKERGAVRFSWADTESSQRGQKKLRAARRWVSVLYLIGDTSLKTQQDSHGAYPESAVIMLPGVFLATEVSILFTILPCKCWSRDLEHFSLSR